MFEVKDFRTCPLEELTEQEISSRLALAKDAWRELQDEVKELEKIIEGLQTRQSVRRQAIASLGNVSKQKIIK